MRPFDPPAYGAMVPRDDPTRDERLKAALRANLRRRKMGAGDAEPPAEPRPSGEVTPPAEPPGD